jgi:hypothetical protein
MQSGGTYAFRSLQTARQAENLRLYMPQLRLRLGVGRVTGCRALDPLSGCASFRAPENCNHLALHGTLIDLAAWTCRPMVQSDRRVVAVLADVETTVALELSRL